MAQLRDKRIVRCALAAVGSAALLVAFLELLTVFPTRVNVVLFGLALIVFFLGYLRSPYFSRRQTGGEPCPACGGLGYPWPPIPSTCTAAAVVAAVGEGVSPPEVRTVPVSSVPPAL
ncbi:hypothetical protein [Miltoncostaea oceani]|uniref:hypothetical protein n=1 Tax=Miltoncostaea oceani TaxID=2843216 RepID=UPI001C3D2D50|nr:hypothetical protein [Miltoncostaea oceani]